LRVAISLARLLSKRERRDEARSAGTPYGWFTEGFDTPDLMRRKTARLSEKYVEH
jgi:hypothetical protein